MAGVGCVAVSEVRFTVMFGCKFQVAEFRLRAASYNARYFVTAYFLKCENCFRNLPTFGVMTKEQ